LTYFLSICKFGDEQKVENHVDGLRQYLTFLAQSFAIFSQNKFESERHQHTKQKFSILQIPKKTRNLHLFTSIKMNFTLKLCMLRRMPSCLAEFVEKLRHAADLDLQFQGPIMD
jgi:hypothetical protein